MSKLPLSNCDLCPRLVSFRESNQAKFPDFYNGAVNSFGSLDAKLLVVGLAPGLKGANATARPFTGDYAGEILYPALVKTGFASANTHKPANNNFLKHYSHNSPLNRFKPESLQLTDCRITNAVRCVPPENKPIGTEISQCNEFLTYEISMMHHLEAILTLGLIAHKAVLKSLKQKQSQYDFKHAACHEVTLNNGLKPSKTIKLFNSYHTSRYNINTGRLTEEMFLNVIENISEQING